MNAIIALCHFCELHGPKILYCTQTFRPLERSSDNEDSALSDSSRKQVRSPSFSAGSSVCSTDSVTTSSASTHSSNSKDSTRDHLCEGCKSVKTGYMSHDEEAQLNYISTQQPYIPQIFTRMRQACIRSLSCEVCPGREGPIFFGDEQNGYVLSHTFYVSDAQARGLKRWYSIVVFMMDRIYLLNSWPFLVPQLRIIIEMLQSKAEKGERHVDVDKRLVTLLQKCLIQVTKEEADKNPQGISRTSATLEPRNFLMLKQRSGNNKPARSLLELTGERNIFKMLHVAFVWTLKACGSRITETLLEGPPTEDSIIDMEKQEETEEGFIKVYTRKISSEASLLTSQDQISDALTQNMYYSREVSTESGGTDKTNVMAEEGKPIIKGLRHLRQILGNEKFQILTHHVIIGNQIIACCSDKLLLSSLFDTLKILLPKGCCRIIYHSDKYEESWRCNFLGQNPNTTLSDHVLSSERFLMLEIILHEDYTISSLDSDISEVDEDFTSYEFRLYSPVSLPEKAPTVLNKMHMAIRNENLNEHVMEQCFVCLKEEWMNKVKVLFKFTKAGGGRSEDETQKLLLVVDAKEEDKPLLKFWMTGLSVQYRTHILASSKQR